MCFCVTEISSVRWAAFVVFITLLPACGTIGQPRGDRAPASMGDMPEFPWPVPKPSTRIDIFESFLPATATVQLKDVANKIERAFDAVGYVERSYYRVPKGFALASRLEQIYPDGSPVEGNARWSVRIPPPMKFSLPDYLKALFAAPQGRYRIIVFVVTSEPVWPGPNPPTREEAEPWVASGLNKLPAVIGNLPYTPDYKTSALVYEFERGPGDEEPVLRFPTDIPGRVHLEKSGLWQALRS